MAKAIDLTGQHFGKLTVMYRNGSRNGKALWHCQCECGNEVDVLGCNLRRKTGGTRSCGCEKSSDLTGKKFGLWTVIERAEGSGYGSRWVCKCECGTIRTVSRKSLVAGTSKSCGCTKIKYNEDYTGQVFQNWVVLEKENHNDSNQYWKCQCAFCGAEKVQKISELQGTRILGCGQCYIGRRKDITNQKFGKLIALSVNWEKTKSQNYSTTFWNCKCDCGNERVVRIDYLLDGTITSCGCSHLYSKGEQKIEEILTNNGYLFEKQKTFPDLVSKKNRLLRFDFYLKEKNLLIEYQGQQHYHLISAWDEDESDLQDRLEKDEQKRQYCIKNNIKLIEIPYWDYNKISLEYLQERIEKNESSC